MSDFTVRIELHGASGEEYQSLHEAMQASGFAREIAGVDSSGNPGVWAMPTAEYDYKSDVETAHQVRDKAKAIADGVKRGAWVLVTEVKTRSWNTNKLRSTL